MIVLFLFHLIFLDLTSTQALSSSSLSGSSRLLEVCKEAKNNSEERIATILPGVYDALSAKVFAKEGAKALYISGFGVSAAKLGQPDVGLLTQTEMGETLRSIIQAVAPYSTPVIVDGDTGYGGALNIRRTIRDFAAAGAAAVSIEDQLFPKKCTYAAGSGVRVVSFEECKKRIEIALTAREETRKVDGNDILIIARTDCRAALGLDEVVRRCKMFEDLGADICYAENLQSKEEYLYLKEQLNPSTLTMLAQVQKLPQIQEEQYLFTAREIGELGYDLALFGVTPLQAVVNALEKSASEMLRYGCSGFICDTPLGSFQSLKDAVGFSEAEDFES